MTESIEAIYNYVQISDAIATAGQPTADQLTAIRDAGYQVVINLALPTSTNALPHERDLVEALGMEYLTIPILWEAPTLADVEQFFAAMQAIDDRRVFVHCAANMRVSALMYLYRILVEQVDSTAATADLHQIWTPNEIWQQLINQAIQKYSKPIL